MHQLKLDFLREIRAVEDALRKMRAIYRALPNDAGAPAAKRVKRKAKKSDTLELVDLIAAAKPKRARKAPAKTIAKKTKRAKIAVTARKAKPAKRAKLKASATRRSAWTNGHAL